MRFFAAVLAFLCTAATAAESLPLAIPFDFENNQIFVKVGINDAPPAWFIVDSGASACVIDSGVARRLGLETEGERTSSSCATSSTSISTRRC
jgi:hypothetical protein